MNDAQKHILRHMTRGQRIAFDHAVQYKDRKLAQRIWGYALETCAALCDTIPSQAGAAHLREVGSHPKTPAGHPIPTVKSETASNRPDTRRDT